MNLAAFLPTSLSALMFLWMASITTSSSSSYSCFATAFFLPTSQIIPTATNGVHSVTKNKLLSLLFLQHHHRAEKIVTTPPSSSNVHRRQFPSTTKLHAAEINNSNNNIDQSRIVTNDLGLDIVRGTGMENADEISDQTWEEIEESAPSKLMIVKNLLGINIFTYILAALIVFFLSMNAIFGVGWLGQSLGWENVGTYTKVSESLPLDVDVSGSNYLL